MIKPYYEHEHTAKFVEVEGYGVISLEHLPLLVRPEEHGFYQIDWINTEVDGKPVKMLCEHGGSTGINYGGAPIGVIRKIE